MNSVGCIPGVNYQLSFIDNSVVVVSVVVGHDQHAIVASYIFQRRRGHVQVVVPTPADEWKEWIVISYLGSALTQQLDDRQGGRFAQVVDILFVSYPQYQHLRAIQRLVANAQSVNGFLYDVVGHLHVDFTSQLDEPGSEIELLCFPGKI